VEQSQVLIRELQERIQSDDRVGELEASLQNVQDRASELEFQLSKSMQVCRP
jgi:myosin protein heavy chain